MENPIPQEGPTPLAFPTEPRELRHQDLPWALRPIDSLVALPCQASGRSWRLLVSIPYMTE